MRKETQYFFHQFEEWIRENNLTIPIISKMIGISEIEIQFILSHKEITQSSLKKFELLMKEYQEIKKSESDTDHTNIHFNMKLSEYSSLQKKALELHCTVEELITRTLISLYDDEYIND